MWKSHVETFLRKYQGVRKTLEGFLIRESRFLLIVLQVRDQVSCYIFSFIRDDYLLSFFFSILIPNINYMSFVSSMDGILMIQRNTFLQVSNVSERL